MLPPPPTNLEVGEIAVNNNSQNPFLAYKNSDGSIVPYYLDKAIYVGTSGYSISENGNYWKIFSNPTKHYITQTFLVIGRDNNYIPPLLFSISVSAQNLIIHTPLNYYLEPVCYVDNDSFNVYMHEKTLYCFSAIIPLYNRTLSNIIWNPEATSEIPNGTKVEATAQYLVGSPDLDAGFMSKADKQKLDSLSTTHYSLSINGQLFNNTKDMEISQIDCGEF